MSLNLNQSSTELINLKDKWVEVRDKDSGEVLYRVPVLSPAVIKALSGSDVIAVIVKNP